ncbi:MAG TPA: ion channel [Bryobacteraceae bacterium]|jgi:inward rectifier potassium channel|nr:ion channel [Bryobacteraceae bacterium]
MSQLQSPSPVIGKPTYDPGLTQQYAGVLKRAINKDGKFNVRRTGLTWRDVNPYLFLINASWPLFLLLVATMFVIVITAFAGVYSLIGTEHIKNSHASTAAGSFLNLFFFSAHTLTTVGYGNMYPNNASANAVAVVEAFVGLMAFAIATGLLFGRFSRPSARFGFSESMLVTPYSAGTSLQFRVVNRRSNNLIDVEARVLLMTVDLNGGKLQRKYVQLELERNQVLFLPLTWTVVHPIDANSPFSGKTAGDLEQLQAEVLIMLKAFDDTFGQTVHARYSYRFDEITWGARFAPAFEIDRNGDLQVEVNRVGLIEQAPLSQ